MQCRDCSDSDGIDLDIEASTEFIVGISIAAVVGVIALIVYTIYYRNQKRARAIMQATVETSAIQQPEMLEPKVPPPASYGEQAPASYGQPPPAVYA